MAGLARLSVAPERSGPESRQANNLRSPLYCWDLRILDIRSTVKFTGRMTISPSDKEAAKRCACPNAGISLRLYECGREFDDT